MAEKIQTKRALERCACLVPSPAACLCTRVVGTVSTHTRHAPPTRAGFSCRIGALTPPPRHHYCYYCYYYCYYYYYHHHRPDTRAHARAHTHAILTQYLEAVQGCPDQPHVKSTEAPQVPACTGHSVHRCGVQEPVSPRAILRALARAGGHGNLRERWGAARRSGRCRACARAGSRARLAGPGHLLEILILDVLADDFFVRLDLQQLEREAQELAGEYALPERATDVRQVARDVNQ